MKKEKSSRLVRSDLWHNIYNIVNQIPREKVDCDAVDALSAATMIEELFLELKNEKIRYKRQEIDYVSLNLLFIVNAELRKGWELTSLTYRNSERIRLKFRKPV